MSLSIKQKIVVATIVIVILTLSIIKLFLNKNKALMISFEISQVIDEPQSDNENFDFEPYTEQESFTNVIEGLDILKSMKRAFEKPFEKLKDGIQKPINDVKDAFMDPINKIVNFVNDVKRAFDNIPVRVAHFSNAFRKIDEGIKLEFINLGLSLKKGFDDIFDLVGTVGNCGIKTITNIRTCMIWYIIDLIGTTLYNIIVVLPIFITRSVIGFNLQPFVDMIHGYIEQLDSLLQYVTCSKERLFHFPKWVIELCYTCEFDTQIRAIKTDWTETIPRLMNEPTKIFKEAGIEFESVWKKM